MPKQNATAPESRLSAQANRHYARKQLKCPSIPLLCQKATDAQAKHKLHKTTLADFTFTNNRSQSLRKAKHQNKSNYLDHSIYHQAIT